MLDGVHVYIYIYILVLTWPSIHPAFSRKVAIKTSGEGSAERCQNKKVVVHHLYCTQSHSVMELCNAKRAISTKLCFKETNVFIHLVDFFLACASALEIFPVVEPTQTTTEEGPSPWGS